MDGDIAILHVHSSATPRLERLAMKRDMVLVYKLLQFVEKNGGRMFKGAIPIEGYERDAVVDHVYLLSGAGFIDLGPHTLADKGALVLTWKGCDYLEDLRKKGS